MDPHWVSLGSLRRVPSPGDATGFWVAFTALDRVLRGSYRDSYWVSREKGNPRQGTALALDQDLMGPPINFYWVLLFFFSIFQVKPHQKAHWHRRESFIVLHLVFTN